MIINTREQVYSPTQAPWAGRTEPLPCFSLFPSPLVRRRCRGGTSSSPAWPSVATAAMSSSLDVEPQPSAPFGRGLRDIRLSSSRREEHASPPLHGTSPSPPPSLPDVSILAPGKSARQLIGLEAVPVGRVDRRGDNHLDILDALRSRASARRIRLSR